MNSSVPRRGYGCCLSFVLYIISVYVIVQLAFPVVNRAIERGRLLRYRVTTTDTPYPFPIVVMTKAADGSAGSPVIVYGRDLWSHPKELAGCSFLIPTRMRKADRVRVPFEDKDVPGVRTKSIGCYEMTPLANGNQAFHVIAMHQSNERGQYTFVSWYEATPKELIPKYWAWNRDFNTTFGILPPYLFCYTILWLAAPWCFRFTRRLIRRGSQSSPPDTEG